MTLAFVWFAAPFALLLLLLIPVLWWFTLRLTRQAVTRRTRLALSMRSGAIGVLALALAGPQLHFPSHQQSTVFLLDTSGSVAPSQRERALGFVQSALAAMPPQAQAAVVAFGGRAQIVRALGPERDLPPLPTVAEGATNIADAVQLGLTLLPGDGYRRLVLLSDGGETAGDLRALTAALRRQGVVLDVLPLSNTADGLDAQVLAMHLPQGVRAGQQVEAKLHVSSSAATPARLVVAADGRTVATQALALQAGPDTITVALPPQEAGFRRYTARLEVLGDARPQNNLVEGFSAVEGMPRVLLVEGRPQAATALERALRAAQLDPLTVTPRAMPDSLPALSAYEAVVLLNVPLQELPIGGVAALPAYVREMGRGLAMIGGDQSFGAGGYRGSPIEDLLPVEMDPRSLERNPATSIAVVIDTSGSMAQREGQRTKLELAAEGTARIAQLLRDDDELTVIPFDIRPTGVIGPLAGAEREQVIAESARMQIGLNGGGITVRSALLEAARYLRASQQPVRHIVLLADGDDAEEQEGVPELLRELLNDSITTSVVAIGRGRDLPFLERTAAQGDGRYFFADKATNLPAILADEAQQVLRPYLIEERFVPARVARHAPLSDDTALTALDGYVATRARPTAQTVLLTPQQEPLLATWQVGLGRGLAWTSDLGGRWASELVAQPTFPQLATRLVGWLLPTTPNQSLQLSASAAQGQVALTVHASQPDGQPRSGLRSVAELRDAQNRPQTVMLREVAPGRYTGAALQIAPGSYAIEATVVDATGAALGVVAGGVTMPGAAEYRFVDDRGALLQEAAQLTGGQIEPLAEAVFAPTNSGRGTPWVPWRALIALVALLLPLEIAVRRLPSDGIRWHALRDAVALLLTRAAPQAHQRRYLPGARLVPVARKATILRKRRDPWK